MIYHFNENAPEPKLFEPRIWNRNAAFTSTELAVLVTITNLALAATISKIEGLNLPREQEQEVFEMLAAKFPEEISRPVQQQCLRMAGMLGIA